MELAYNADFQSNLEKLGICMSLREWLTSARSFFAALCTPCMK